MKSSEIDTIGYKLKKRHFEIVNNFLGEEPEIDDSIGMSLQCVVAQFLVTFSRDLAFLSEKQTRYTASDIINIQIESLRKCIIDLSVGKERMTKGATKQ